MASCMGGAVGTSCVVSENKEGIDATDPPLRNGGGLANEDHSGMGMFGRGSCATKGGCVHALVAGFGFFADEKVDTVRSEISRRKAGGRDAEEDETVSGGAGGRNSVHGTSCTADEPDDVMRLSGSEATDMGATDTDGLKLLCDDAMEAAGGDKSEMSLSSTGFGKVKGVGAGVGGGGGGGSSKKVVARGGCWAKGV
jgi:hypothetical protein